MGSDRRLGNPSILTHNDWWHTVIGRRILRGLGGGFFGRREQGGRFVPPPPGRLERPPGFAAFRHLEIYAEKCYRFLKTPRAGPQDG